MLGRILNILGWIGTGLVIAAVGVRFARPELQQVWYGLAVAGLVCVLLYLLSQWREIAGTFTRRQARYGALSVASALIVLGDSRRHQLHRGATEQALGSHRQQGSSACRTRR